MSVDTVENAAPPGERPVLSNRKGANIAIAAAIEAA
jgi:hypothetical protein